MTRHRPTEERRRQILDATLSCFLDEGFHATTVERIANTPLALRDNTQRTKRRLANKPKDKK